jgi:hypothetical protein
MEVSTMIELYLTNAAFAIVFAAIGYGFSRSRMRYDVNLVVEQTIINLIENGYLRTRGHGDDAEILKWNQSD